MSLAGIILYVSIFFWIFPAIRQYKGNYFHYFLILALSDPINIFCVSFIGVTQGWVHSVAGLLLVYSVGYNNNEFRKYLIHNTVLILVFISLLLVLPNLRYLILATHMMILAKFLKIAFVHLHNNSKLNLFYLALIFYEITIVINFIDLITGISVGITFFYIILAFQILLAIFFTIFREENPMLNFKLRTSP